MSRIYEINFQRLAIILLPTFLRKPIRVAFVQALLAPVKLLYRDFMAKRTSVIYDLEHNGQVCRLRKLLNDQFDPVLRRIRITDGNLYPRKYIYTNAEEQPKYLGTVYLRQTSDYADSGVDFRVVVPSGFALVPVLAQMNATINYYKLAAKRYKIQFDE